jgi:glutathione peroxidase
LYVLEFRRQVRPPSHSHAKIDDLQELTTVYDKLKEKDFEVLAFPCNQFGGQEPGSANEIKKFAGDKYGASYPLFSKVDVNGPKAEPLFQYLKKEAGGGDIAWNFGKFLVDKDGKVVKRFDPRTNPLAIEGEIEKFL